MNLVPRSPIAVHFGALDSRLLQLSEGRRNASVTAHETVAASGRTRQTAVAEALAPRLRNLGFRGSDCAIGLSTQEVAMTLVPVDAAARPRRAAILQDTAARTVQDEEGVEYCCLAVLEEGEGDSLREEYLVFAMGAADKRRSLTAVEALKWRPIGMEASPFPLIRALSHTGASGAPWGVLHVGFGHSFLAIAADGQLRFLKQMHLTGERLLATLHRALQDDAAGGQDAARLARLLQADEREAGGELRASAGTLPDIQRMAVGRARAVLEALQLETAAFAGEVRACMRHFAHRHGGERLSAIRLSGFGAGLPEMETLIGEALAVEASIARPFTERGIRAPEEILAEEHLWTIPLGLALRSSQA